MKIYFNTKAFDELALRHSLDVTTVPEKTELLVLGAKKVEYPVFSNLKAVYRFGVGAENIDFEYLKEKKIPVYFPGAKAKEVLYDATANFTVYAILNRLYAGAFGDVNSWQKAEREYIGNKTALVIGLGNIGNRVMLKLKFFMKVETYDEICNKESELEELIKRADVITIHIPLSQNTRNFFDRKKLSWLKNNAIIVNTARGELFDEEALYEKLSGSDCRAFFDVFWKEPYEGKLKGLGKEKFFMTPHSASNTKDFIMEGFNDILGILKGLER